VHSFIVTFAAEYITNLIKEGKTASNWKEMRRIDLIQKMQKQGLDFRMLNNFKQLLFTENKGDASTSMPLAEFQRIKNLCDH